MWIWVRLRFNCFGSKYILWGICLIMWKNVCLFSVICLFTAVFSIKERTLLSHILAGTYHFLVVEAFCFFFHFWEGFVNVCFRTIRTHVKGDDINVERYEGDESMIMAFLKKQIDIRSLVQIRMYTL